jgi:hypothetical protein
VPAEHARLVRPVTGRDLRVVAILLAVCAVAVAFGAAAAQGGPAPSGRGCVQADVAGVMGGGTVRGCGDRAAAVCRVYAPVSAQVAAQCAAISGRAVRGGTRPASAGPADPGARSAT